MNEVLNAITQPLRTIPHWVNWKYIELAGKKTKCRVSPRFG